MFQEYDDQVQISLMLDHSYRIAVSYTHLEVLYRDGGLAVTDIQEGEISITNLYIEIEKAAAKQEGREFSEDEINIPAQFDFRMFVPKK